MQFEESDPWFIQRVDFCTASILDTSRRVLDVVLAVLSSVNHCSPSPGK